MKFLCVPCDKPMTLENTASDRGSVSLTYACPACGYEFAMLTNPMETQVVGSLGVSISGASDSAASEPSKCPFTGIVQQMSDPDAPAPRGLAWTPQAEARMHNVPDFVKPMVRGGIERFAADRGYGEIDERVLEEARAFFGM